MSTPLERSWTAVLGDAPASIEFWSELVTRWSEPHRVYHGLAHLSAVLGVVDEFADHAADPDTVRLAAWYHDAIYDPRRTDNEERSAALAEEQLPGAGVSAARVASVARLVRLTVNHHPEPADRDGELLCDADLLVLASPPSAYLGYAGAIRAEYAHVSDEDFRTGRAEILRSLLDAPRLYRLPQLAGYEDAARANLAAELAVLNGRRA